VAAREATFFDLKGHVANIFGRLGISEREITIAKGEGCDIFSAYLTIATRSGKQLGEMGLVSKAVLAKADVRQPVVYAQLDWDALVRLALKKNGGIHPAAQDAPP